MTTGEIAARAADLIEERGLAKHVMMDQAGQVCVAGAIGLAVTGDTTAHGWWRGSEEDAAMLAVCTELGLPKGSSHWETQCAVVMWNNAPERAPQDVIAVLRVVAAKEAAAAKSDPHVHALDA